jgi:hypothetical protein
MGRSEVSFTCFGGSPLSTCVVFRRFTGIHFNTLFRAMGTAVMFSQVLKGVSAKLVVSLLRQLVSRLRGLGVSLLRRLGVSRLRGFTLGRGRFHPLFLSLHFVFHTRDSLPGSHACETGHVA